MLAVLYMLSWSLLLTCKDCVNCLLKVMLILTYSIFAYTYSILG